jgi:hypothetical protein
MVLGAAHDEFSCGDFVNERPTIFLIPVFKRLGPGSRRNFNHNSPIESPVEETGSKKCLTVSKEK